MSRNWWRYTSKYRSLKIYNNIQHEIASSNWNRISKSYRKYKFAFWTQIPSRSPPREYRSLRTCHEVTIGVEPAGAAKYCILVKELRSSSSLTSVTTVPDQCGLHRRRRSEYTFEVCEEKPSPPKDRALPFTLRRLQPGKAYLLQITAQLKGQSLSYPLLGVRTRRSCVT